MARTFGSLVASVLVELRRGPAGTPDLNSDDADYARRHLIDVKRDYEIRPLPRIESTKTFTPTDGTWQYVLADAPISTRFKQIKRLFYENADGSLESVQGPSTFPEVWECLLSYDSTYRADEVLKWCVVQEKLAIAPRPSGDRNIRIWGPADNDYAYQWNSSNGTWEFTKNGTIDGSMDAWTDAVWFDHLGDLLIAGALRSLLDGPFDPGPKEGHLLDQARARESRRYNRLRIEQVQNRAGTRLKPHL